MVLLCEFVSDKFSGVGLGTHHSFYIFPWYFAVTGVLRTLCHEDFYYHNKDSFVRPEHHGRTEGESRCLAFVDRILGSVLIWLLVGFLFLPQPLVGAVMG